MSAAPSYSLTTSPALAPLPLKAGEASSVEPPAGIEPVTAPWSSVATTVAGVVGAVVSSTIG